eukprot:CAMPEP_0172762946 /NCGR_PEP_ID=MMETSP1074-20121228/174453_1 /TAXON_ID=2916 /ORGANISM="Ceratium fusus, Strain PA161109" /LENGTH=138 /DNA_ID=CAMNT_0013597433 /DNA_START=202 /DNA_END=618 /DNA_ORIENTATION=+
MPATVHKPIVTPPRCLTTALTSNPPAACNATGATVHKCQPRKAVDGLFPKQLNSTNGRPHNASSRLNRALGRALPANAACERAAARPEQAAVANARQVPDIVVATAGAADFVCSSGWLFLTKASSFLQSGSPFACRLI